MSCASIAVVAAVLGIALGVVIASLLHLTELPPPVPPMPQQDSESDL